MTKTEALEHFGGVTAVAKALGMSKQAVSLWPERIPGLQQYRLMVATGGQLQVDPDFLPPRPMPVIRGPGRGRPRKPNRVA